jgi:hypothetical protein
MALREKNSASTASTAVVKNSELPSIFVLCVTVRGIGSWWSQCASDTAAVCPPYGYGRLGRNSELGPDTFRRGLFSLEKSQGRKKAARESLCLPRSDWNCPLFLNGRADKGVPAALHPPVRQPDDCRPRTRHVWGTRQSRRFLTWPAALLCLSCFTARPLLKRLHRVCANKPRTRQLCRFWKLKDLLRRDRKLARPALECLHF